MKTSVHILFVILAVCLQLSSCSKEDQTTQFTKLIKTTFPEWEVEAKGFVNLPPAVSPSYLAISPDSGYLVVSDPISNAILLFNHKGSELLSRTGRAGRGAAEFKNISQLHFGDDKALYVPDLLLKRITKFNIDNKKLEYVTTFNLKAAKNLSLRDIFVTKYGNFGVFRRMDNYKSWEESFHLYKLDETFNPVKHLLEMPGNDKVKISKYIYIDRPLGQKTYWALNGEWFYYIVSNSPQVNRYNIRTGKKEKTTYFSLKERTNTKQTARFLKNRMSPTIKSFPLLGKAIEESPVIPFFDYFRVRNNHILFKIFYASGKGSLIIDVNQATKKVHYMALPFYIWRFSLSEDTIYGMGAPASAHGPPRISVMKLNR